MFPRIHPLLNDVLNGPLPSDGPSIVDAGACFGCRGNVFPSNCLAIDAFSVSAILAFSHHITVY
jgi:hypothetical protein